MSDDETDKYGVSPLSNYDIVNTVTKDMKDRVNIIDTQELEDINTIEDIFHNRGHAVLFLPPDDGSTPVGHWVCLLRQKTGGRTRKGNVIYFDSYGDPLPNGKIKQILKQKYKVIEQNGKRYQQYETNLCGFWCLLMISLNKIIPNLNLDLIERFLKKKPSNMSYDEFVGRMTEAI